jgi:crotonobetainyl-CoA:carnitine CoA-transferase CaiB-like acyl-CoA transferase
MDARYENRAELIALLDEIFKTRTRVEWEKRMLEAGDLIFERVQRTLDLASDPQVIENEYIVDFDHAALGKTKWLQTPVTFSKTPVSTRKMAPAQGENTEELLIELLDYSWDDIAELQGQGVIL